MRETCLKKCDEEMRCCPVRDIIQTLIDQCCLRKSRYDEKDVKENEKDEKNEKN